MAWCRDGIARGGGGHLERDPSNRSDERVRVCVNEIYGFTYDLGGEVVSFGPDIGKHVVVERDLSVIREDQVRLEVPDL